MEKDITQLQKGIGISFKNIDLLEEACTHRSYLNENTKWHLPHNERLEFLGDAVLELVVTERLFAQFPMEDEGKLTSIRAALVNYQSLANVARNIHLGEYIRMSKGESKDTGKARDVILANAMEALLGAIYLDGGYVSVAKVIDAYVMPQTQEIIDKQLFKDAKSVFQEQAQEKFKVTPTYKVIGENGPDHKKTFTVGVFLNEKQVGKGAGLSKQEAEIEAAKNALYGIEKIRN